MGTQSFRNFKIGEQFKKEFKDCANKKDRRFKCESNVRRRYRDVENGRLHQMGDNINTFISKLDPDEVQTFKKQFPGAVKIANEFAIVEELKKF